jgi:hypothetical protein
VIDGYFLPIPPEHAEGLAGTVVVFDSAVDDALSDGFLWSEVYENRIYFSTIDGDLVSMPIPNEWTAHALFVVHSACVNQTTMG